MLHNALNLIRSGSKHIGKSFLNKAAQGASNFLGDAVDIGHRYMLPMHKYEGKIDNWFNKLHGIAERNVIEPSPNASFGLGTKGAKELSPAFVGDRQELFENNEIIQHNPIPPRRPKSPPIKIPQRVEKIVQKVEDEDQPIFRTTGKKMPVSLMLPAKKEPRRKIIRKAEVQKPAEAVEAPKRRGKRKMNYKVVL